MIVITRHSGSLLLVLALALTPGCSREPASEGTAAGQDKPALAQIEAEPAQQAAPAQPAAGAPEPGQASTLSPEARTAVDDALAAYEQLRAQLAADKTESVTEMATQLERAATRAAAVIPAPLQARAQAVASSALRLKDTAGKNADEIRSSFGEVSRAVVALISAEPALAQGRHVFECPMAQGYQKWVQKDETIANPYMGTRMLACGVKSGWSE